MRFLPLPFVLQLAAVCVSCFGAVARGRALSTGGQDSHPPLDGVQEGPFTNHLSTIAGGITSGRFHLTDATESSDGRPEDLEETPTPFNSAASGGHEDSPPESGVHTRRETLRTGGSLQEPLASTDAAKLHRRREREAPKPWLSDDEGSGFSSETEWDDEDLFLQQRRASRPGRKGGPTPGRRKNVDWLQLQGVSAQHGGQKADHGRQQAAARNELPSRQQGPRSEAPSRRPQHANAAKRRSKKRHRMKADQQRPSSSLLPQPATAATGGGRSAQRQHQRKRQRQKPQQQRTTTAPQPLPLPRMFGGGDMSLESRIRALKRIAGGAEEDDGSAVHPLELPAYQFDDSARWSPQDEWASGWDQRLWRVLGSGSDGGGGGAGSLDYGDAGRPHAASAPPQPPHQPPPVPATPPPPPATRAPPAGRSTAATPVNPAAARMAQPTQSRHFAYHRVTEAQPAASHHQEAFVAVSMVELPGNRSREHASRGRDHAHPPFSPENLSTGTASWQTPGTTTASPLLPAVEGDVIGDHWVGHPDHVASGGSDHWTSGGGGGDPWVSSSRSGGGGGGLQALPTWFRLRHRGRHHFRKGAMEELMNRHREEQWLRRRLGLPPESPHQQFAG